MAFDRENWNFEGVLSARQKPTTVEWVVG